MEAAAQSFEDTLAKSLRARIGIERAALRREEDSEDSLMRERKRLLIEGSEFELDDVENRIGASRNVQVRAIERIQILEQFLPEKDEDAHA